MENITVKINGVELEVPKGTTVLEAAHMAGFDQLLLTNWIGVALQNFND